MSFIRISLAVSALLLLVLFALFVLALAETRERISALEAERSLAETRHGQIEYMSWGEGPPVLVVHGAGGGFVRIGQAEARLERIKNRLGPRLTARCPHWDHNLT